MRAIRAVAMIAVSAGLGLGTADSEAKRLGSTSGAGLSSASRHVGEDVRKGGVTISPTFRSSAGAAAGGAAGAAAAKALMDGAPMSPPGPDAAAVAAAAEKKRLEKLSEFERKAEIEEAAKRAEQAAATADARYKAEQAAAEAAARHRQELQEAKRRAAEQRLADLKSAALEREKSCIIKPAMSDAEIAYCKWAWSFPPP